jgi:hypothetical protein
VHSVKTERDALFARFVQAPAWRPACCKAVPSDLSVDLFSMCQPNGRGGAGVVRQITPWERRAARTNAITAESLSRCTPETPETMSQKTVQLVIGRLVTDEEYRLRFLSDPLGVLNRLHDQGVELTRGEIEALVRTDRTLWTEAAERIDSHLQRCSLRKD